MLSKSCLDLLSLVSVDDYKALCHVPRVSTVAGSVVSQLDDAVSSVQSERRIIVANQLPIKAFRDEESKAWSFEFDNDSLVLQLRDGLPSDVDVLYVGSLKEEVDVSEQDEVSQVLLERFRCVPTFLPADIHYKYYHGFCKHYLWPLFHYMVPMSTTQGGRFDRSEWQAYVVANRIFANKVTEVINPDEDYVWVHDYHLMILPTLLRKRFHRLKLGFFMHNTFPSSEIYRTIPVRDDLLRSLLNCDLIGFHTFDYARHFLSCCSRMFGLDYESKRGYIGLDYYGRTVMIKILPAGIHMGQLESVISLAETAEKIRELRKEYEGKFVILGVDDMDMFKGVNLKFLAMGQLLDMHEELRGNVVLVQILNPARSEGKDIQDVQSETNAIAKEVNEKHGKPGYQPITIVNGPVSTSHKAAYCAIAECCVVNAVRDGLNLVPYMYTVCRQGTSVLEKALEEGGEGNESKKPKESMIIVSEFIGCSPSLSGAIRVNPWNIEEVSDAMKMAVTMTEAEKRMRHEKHYKYISSHDVTYWAKSFDQDLERACREHYLKRYWGVGLGFGFRIVALDPTFRKLSMDGISCAYKNTQCRLILLDYDGTMLPQSSMDRTPTEEVISILNCLCSDPKNVVFIVSGRDKNCLSNWFSPCKKLGLSAEHGFFTRWSADSSWESCGLTMDFDWKKIAEPVMALYTESTDGSFIEHKDSAMVWHHQEADPHFGSAQAKELLDHLESVLANEPVMVKRGQHIVEVNPQGVSKGTAVDSLISSMKKAGKPLDFLLCIGDDRSDEDMFESIAGTVSKPEKMPPAIGKVFACTVGQKPSMAQYYLDDTFEVMKLLNGLANVSAYEAAPPSSPRPICYTLEDASVETF